MPENKTPESEVEIQNEKFGKVTFNSDVVATIAGLATIDVEGVAGMSGGLVSGVAELLGRRNLTKGVKVEVGEEECAVDLSLVVEYGVRIQDVCANVQQGVYNAIDTMTGLKPVEVNVYVQGVQIEKKEEPAVLEEPEPEEQRVK